MKILLYSQFCTPEPIFKSVPFAKELARRGHEVRIVTGFPNYPGGKLYPGYAMRWRQREVLDGIPILRVALFPSHDQSGLRRLATYASFAISSAPAVLTGWRPDVVYLYNLVTLSAVAILNRLFRGVHSVLDVQDLWPDSIFQAGMARSWLRRPLEAICRLAYSRVSRLVALSPGLRAELIRRGVSAESIEVIYNWCDEEVLKTAERGEIRMPPREFADRFNILFAGNIGLVQGLDSVIEAAAITSRINQRIQFVFMGSGVALDDLKKKAASVAPGQTLFLPARPARDAIYIQRAADVLLIHLQNNPLFEITVPSKTQAYLALGKPILAAVRGDTADLVTRASAGLIAQPGDPSSIANAALRMAALSPQALQAMGVKGSEFYWQELSLGAGVTRFEHVFAAAAGVPSPLGSVK